MTRYAMSIDLNFCIGCYNCQIACKDEHVGNDFPGIAVSQPKFGHFWLGIEERERVLDPSHIKVTYIPRLCVQCGDAPCIAAAKNGAVYRRADGIVIIDPEKAVGQKQLVDSCPYGAIYWNEEKNVAQKCTFCAHLLDDGWTEPRCAQTCPTDCIYFGDLDDPESKISKFAERKKEEPLRPDLPDKPLVQYVGLPKPYLSGSVVYADKNESAVEVTVSLKGPAGKETTTQTDFFGDFAFNDVAMGKHTISCEAQGYKKFSRDFVIAKDIEYLGDISLEKK
jgi:Fe-S-cluster-containing dehydrogenase component